eukprot:comp19103_c0_seq1/m.21677 comp19103_c0_seq1/g.21677  ORF comp19103_c0_seq1/g.21677 comp19103_c0_seq1/m.21677 type:complete len:348 (-) comp19103_c0_seq1:350-1393(-)
MYRTAGLDWAGWGTGKMMTRRRNTSRKAEEAVPLQAKETESSTNVLDKENVPTKRAAGKRAAKPIQLPPESPIRPIKILEEVVASPRIPFSTIQPTTAETLQMTDPLNMSLDLEMTAPTHQSTPNAPGQNKGEKLAVEVHKEVFLPGCAVWVKIGRSRHWPGLVLKKEGGSDRIPVELFGSMERVECAQTDLQPYAAHRQELATVKGMAFAQALALADAHIKQFDAMDTPKPASPQQPDSTPISPKEMKINPEVAKHTNQNDMTQSLEAEEGRAKHTGVVYRLKSTRDIWAAYQPTASAGQSQSPTKRRKRKPTKKEAEEEERKRQEYIERQRAYFAEVDKYQLEYE